MRRIAFAILAAVCLAGLAIAQEQQVPKLPKVVPGTVTIPHPLQGPVKTVKPVFPAAALQLWAQDTIKLDVIIAANGDVEDVGCEGYCVLSRPDLVKAAADAVRQWHWNPILVKGQPARVRTQVAVPMLLDETSPPISICNVLKDPKTYNDHVLNVFGTVTRHDGMFLSSDECQGQVVVSEHGDVTPVIEDGKFAALQQALASGPTHGCLRGLMRADTRPGDFAGERLVLERVLRCPAK